MKLRVINLKFKVTMQSAKEDCASACVCAILNNYFSKNISLCEIRPIIKNTLNGTSFGSIQKGLERIGIISTIYRTEKNINVFHSVNYPIITQIQKDDGSYHYIVVIKCRGNKIYYCDPEYSNIRKISYDEFVSKWIAYIIQIDVNASEIKIEIDDNSNHLGFFKLLLKIKGKITVIVILSIAIYFLGIISATMFNAYFNIIIPNKLSGLISTIMIIYMVVSLIKFGLNLLSTILVNSLNKALDTNLSKEFFEELFQKPTSALEYFGIGEILTTLSNVILIRQRFFAIVVFLPLNCIWLFISLFLLFRMNTFLTILVFFLIVLLVLVIAYANDDYKDLSQKVLSSNKEFNDSVIEIFSNIAMIKGYQQEIDFINRGENALLENINSRNRLLNFDAKFTGVKQIILELFNIILFSIGTVLIIDGNFLTGSLLTYNSMLGFAINPLLNLANVQSLFTQGKSAQDLLYNFLNSRINLFGNKKFPKNETNLVLEMKHVNFSYENRTSLLNDVNLSLKDNNSIAITGNNGSGKTTVGKLLSRYYLPDSGTIMVNGLDINEISNIEFYENVLFIDSNEDLISSTIIDNILLGRNIDIEKISKVLNDLKLDEFINKLEKGYDTLVGTDGINLSEGQKQLIKIARATVEEKKIYIFDEIMNGLDSTHKSDIIQYLHNLTGLKIFITHDAQLMESCDNIFRVN